MAWRFLHTRIVFAGGLQEQDGRDEICRVMEGGRDAFEARYRRIMHPKGNTWPARAPVERFADALAGDEA